jgi:uncharacterized membrane protein
MPNLYVPYIYTGSPLYPVDVANDGTTLIAASIGEFHSQAYLWNPVSGLSTVSDLPSRVSAITADGKTVVGARGDPAFWSAENGWTVLGDLPIATPHYDQVTGMGVAISGDGKTIVGQADYSPDFSPQPYTAFRWTAELGMTDLGILPKFNTAEAEAVSYDGSVIAGRMGDSFLGFVFRWTAEGGAEQIGVDGHGAVVMSDDGATIAWPGSGGNYLAVKVWTRSQGVRSLYDILMDAGADIAGWKLLTVGGISADGRTFVGTALDPFGRENAYVAVLPVPEPAAWVALLPCVVLFRRWNRRGCGAWRGLDLSFGTDGLADVMLSGCF